MIMRYRKSIYTNTHDNFRHAKPQRSTCGFAKHNYIHPLHVNFNLIHPSMAL